ncbi:hypothetical protein [Rhizobium mongolense]
MKANDKRIRFIDGIDVYETARGAVKRDLFDEQNSGYALDVALVERLVLEKLEAEAEKLRADGWKWVECVCEFPQESHYMSRVYPKDVPLTDKQPRGRILRACGTDRGRRCRRGDTVACRTGFDFALEKRCAIRYFGHWSDQNQDVGLGASCGRSGNQSFAHARRAAARRKRHACGRKAEYHPICLVRSVEQASADPQ